jgi:ABC-type nickel/cobalt efflux system permease component RcnA
LQLFQSDFHLHSLHHVGPGHSRVAAASWLHSHRIGQNTVDNMTAPATTPRSSCC